MVWSNSKIYKIYEEKIKNNKERLRVNNEKEKNTTHTMKVFGNINFGYKLIYFKFYMLNKYINLTNTT